MTPWGLSNAERYFSSGTSALIVLRMRSNSPRWSAKNPSSDVDSMRAAPRSIASRSFLSERDSTVTSAPWAAAIWTPMWPSPPRPSTATFLPGPAPHRASGA